MRKKVASCSFKTENVQRRTYNVLPLRELEASACALLSVLLAFLAARVAGDESLGLERLAQLRVELHQRARNTQLHRVGLTHHAAALCCAVTKYASHSFLLTVNLPLPGRRNTRAIDDLRRPVP